MQATATTVEACFTPDPDKVLCERSYAGIEVVLLHDPDSGLNVLALREGFEDWQTALVPSDRALDAFEHPYCYLPRV